MADDKVTLCFLHGVLTSGGIADDAWLRPLEATIALNGHPRPSARGIDVRTIRYHDVFGVATQEDATSDRRASSSAASHVDYEVRRDRIARFVKGHATGRPRDGLAGMPEAVVSELAAAAILLGKHLREQARRYNRDERLRAAVVRTVLEQMPTSGRVVIVAHSLGSVVALDVIPLMSPDVDVSLVTVGSPLGFSNYWRFLRFTGDRFPTGHMRSWINIFDAIDPVTRGRGVAARFPEATDVQVPFGSLARLLSNHANSYYLSVPVVAAAVAEGLYGFTEPAEERGLIRSNEIGPDWHLHLLASAYATQVSRTCDPRKHEWRARFDAARRVSAERLLAVAQEHRAELEVGARSVPTLTELVDNAGLLVRRRWTDDELVPFAVGLLMASPVRPFDLGVDSKHAKTALAQVLNRVRQDHPNLSDHQFAEHVADSLETIIKVMRPGGRLGAYLLVAGAVALAATGVGIWAAAPAGLAGGALLTSTLAAFGPGGMVGGMVTMALGSSVGSALVTSGASQFSPDERLDAARFVETLAHLPKEQLEASVVGWLSCVLAKDRLDMPSWADQVRALLQNVLVDVVNEVNVHSGLGSSRAAEWEKKKEIVERALRWLDERFPAPVVSSIRDAMDKAAGDVEVDRKALQRTVQNEALQRRAIAASNARVRLNPSSIDRHAES